MKTKLNDSLFGAFEMKTTEMNQIKGGVDDVFYTGVGTHGNGRKIEDWVICIGDEFILDWYYIA